MMDEMADAILSDDRVKHFYTHSLGWNMFDSKFLTPALEAFLEQESDVLAGVFQNQFSAQPGYNHLVEVGCGYGRYLNWSLSRNLAYDGLDLVPWLIHIGEIRVARMRSLHPTSRCAVHNLPVEKLGFLLQDPMANRREWNTLVFFPFNCFGNIASVREVMKTLQQSGCDVYVSSFQLNETTTELRKQYYTNCGYRKLEVDRSDAGLKITSSEGLHAYAYSHEYLTGLFQEYGFHLTASESLGEIGVGYHFVKTPGLSETKSKTILEMPEQAVQSEQRQSLRVDAEISMTISVLHEDSVADSSSVQPEPGSLLEFENHSGIARNISQDGVLVQSDHAWPVGAIVKLEMNLADTPEVLDTALVFIGIIIRVEERQPGLFDTAIRFERVQPGVVKRLQNRST